MADFVGTEASPGRLGAVLRSLGEPDPVALSRFGPWVVTTAEHARAVLTDPERFDFPTDVSRQPLQATPDGATSTRSPHSITPPLPRESVDVGLRVFAAELVEVAAGLVPTSEFDAMVLLRDPVARSTTAAVLPEVGEATRAVIADRALAWIDALGPVIASPRAPRRWSRVRRAETSTRLALEAALVEAGCPDPAAVATVLAAGIQVPIAAGAWLLVMLAAEPDVADELRGRPDLARAMVWETIRLCPPTWITARITTTAVALGATELPPGAVVLVSPLLLGRLDRLSPGPDAGALPLARLHPRRWEQGHTRPGAWLPFGAGPHACPGRNLGLAQLTWLADWCRRWSLAPVQPVRVDQSRGIFPRPATLRITRHHPDVATLADEHESDGIE